MKETTLALLLWISSHTPLAYDGHAPPEIMRVPHAELIQILYNGEIPQGVDTKTISIAGLYNYLDGKIYLQDDVDLATAEGRAVLVHELVHHLQYYHGLDKSVPCIGSLEPAAYAAQRAYLAEHGKQPDFNEPLVIMASMCWPG